MATQSGILFLFSFIYYLWLCWVFIMGFLQLWCMCFSLCWLLCAAERGLQARRLRSCGAQTQLLQGIWCLPGPGIEPMSLALASRFLTTGPPGKPTPVFLPGMKSHGQRSLTGYTIHGVTKELDTTQQLSTSTNSSYLLTLCSVCPGGQHILGSHHSWCQ